MESEVEADQRRKRLLARGSFVMSEVLEGTRAGTVDGLRFIRRQERFQRRLITSMVTDQTTHLKIFVFFALTSIS